jgi:hypothetical protein
MPLGSPFSSWLIETDDLAATDALILLPNGPDNSGNVVPVPASSTSVRPQTNSRHQQSSTLGSQRRSSKPLACLSCRPRKVKVSSESRDITFFIPLLTLGSASVWEARVTGARHWASRVGCRLEMRDERQSTYRYIFASILTQHCRRHSKEYIENLENQMTELKSMVAHIQAQPRSQPLTLPPSLIVPSPESYTQIQLPQAPISPDFEIHGVQLMPQDELTAFTAYQSESGTDSDSKESIISRLCGAHGRMNNKEGGRPRYFGPTSCLHLTESVNSISRYCQSNSGFGVDQEIPWARQQHLLGLYWKYQHNALHIIHKEAFLAGMESGQGQTPYFTRCLLLCVLASAARISASPEIRALAVPSDNEPDEKPMLYKLAEEAVELELLNPGVTTVQSLLLLGILDCAQSHASKGWMRSGKRPLGYLRNVADSITQGKLAYWLSNLDSIATCLIHLCWSSHHETVRRAPLCFGAALALISRNFSMAF